MTSNNRISDTCLQMDFHAAGTVTIPANMGNLELPRKRFGAKERSFHRGIESFFTDIVADELSHELHSASGTGVECIKIWLYNTDEPNDAQGYQVPDLNEQDLTIHSHLALSKLERIYVLHNGLSGNQYDAWKASCEAMVKPLFHRFMAPQEPPEVLDNFMVMRFGELLSNRLYLSLEMPKHMFFNALVIQTD